VYILNDDLTAYIEQATYNELIHEYYTKTDHIYGYTNLRLPATGVKRDYGTYTFRGYKADATI
jgi:hypothetical protein